MSAEQLKVSSFVTKTYNLINDADTNEVVRWMEDGLHFAIVDQQAFQLEILPRYFKHNKLASFVRQLNTYGFRKTLPEFLEYRVDSSYIIFSHENFRQGRPDLHHLITRKRASDQRKQTQLVSIPTDTKTFQQVPTDELVPQQLAVPTSAQEFHSLAQQTIWMYKRLEFTTQKLREVNHQLNEARRMLIHLRDERRDEGLAKYGESLCTLPSGEIIEDLFSSPSYDMMSYRPSPPLEYPPAKRFCHSFNQDSCSRPEWC